MVLISTKSVKVTLKLNFFDEMLREQKILVHLCKQHRKNEIYYIK